MVSRVLRRAASFGRRKDLAGAHPDATAGAPNGESIVPAECEEVLAGPAAPMDMEEVVAGPTPAAPEGVDHALVEMGAALKWLTALEKDALETERAGLQQDQALSEIEVHRGCLVLVSRTKTSLDGQYAYVTGRDKNMAWVTASGRVLKISLGHLSIVTSAEDARSFLEALSPAPAEDISTVVDSPAPADGSNVVSKGCLALVVETGTDMDGKHVNVTGCDRKTVWIVEGGRMMRLPISQVSVIMTAEAVRAKREAQVSSQCVICASVHIVTRAATSICGIPRWDPTVRTEAFAPHGIHALPLPVCVCPSAVACSDPHAGSRARWVTCSLLDHVLPANRAYALRVHTCRLPRRQTPNPQATALEWRAGPHSDGEASHSVDASLTRRRATR